MGNSANRKVLKSLRFLYHKKNIRNTSKFLVDKPKRVILQKGDLCVEKAHLGEWVSIMADLRESSCYEGTPLPYQQGSQTASLVN